MLIFLFNSRFHFAGLSSEGSSPSEKVVNIMTEIRALQEIIAKFKSLQVDATEYACLKGIVLFKTGKSAFKRYLFFELGKDQAKKGVGQSPHSHKT